MFFFFSSRRRHTRFKCDWSSDVCSSDLHRTCLANLAGDRRDTSVSTLRARYAWLGVRVMSVVAVAALLRIDADFDTRARIATKAVGCSHRDPVPPYGQVMDNDLISCPKRPGAIARPDNFVRSRCTAIWREACSNAYNRCAKTVFGAWFRTADAAEARFARDRKRFTFRNGGSQPGRRDNLHAAFFPAWEKVEGYYVLGLREASRQCTPTVSAVMTVTNSI